MTRISDHNQACPANDQHQEKGEHTKAGALSHVNRCELLNHHLSKHCADQPGCLPKVEIRTTAAVDAHIKQPASSVLESPTASAEQKINALNTLYAAGRKDAHGLVHIKLHDGDKVRDAVIAKQNYGHDRHSIALFSADDNGVTQPVLRAILSGKNIEHQVDSRGQQASFNEEKWSSKLGNSNIGKVSGSAVEVPEFRPALKAKIQPPNDSTVEQPGVDKPEFPGIETDKQPTKPDPRLDQRKPDVGSDETADRAAKEPIGDRAFVTPKDRANHYSPQYDSYSCSTAAMANLYSFQHGGPPPLDRFHHDAGGMLSKHDGWVGGGNGMKGMFEREGLHSRDYTGNGISDKTMADLNRELDQGHSAVLFVKNPHTTHGHFISVYGRDQSGKYILGDPDSYNNSAFHHDRPVSASWVRHLMSGLNGGVTGFVSAWSDNRERHKNA